MSSALLFILRVSDVIETKDTVCMYLNLIFSNRLRVMFRKNENYRRPVLSQYRHVKSFAH